MMPTLPHDVPEELLRTVVAYFNPQRVILFGSRARGDAHEDSDMDLLVVVDDDTPAEKLTLEAGFRSALSFPRATDVIPCRAHSTGGSASLARSALPLTEKEWWSMSGVEDRQTAQWTEAADGSPSLIMICEQPKHVWRPIRHWWPLAPTIASRRRRRSSRG